MASVEKLFKAIKDAPSKGVKRHITHEIVTTYCGVQGLTGTMMSEAHALSVSTSWEDRVAGSRIIEEMVRQGTLPDAFAPQASPVSLDLKKVMAGPKYLASFYDCAAAVPAGKDFIDLDDHNVVLSLSNIAMPGVPKRDESAAKRKKGKEQAVAEEVREIDSAEVFYREVLANLSSFVWEHRHGAAQMVLGIVRGMSQREAELLTTETLEVNDFLRPLLTTLTMDRFNDYEMDNAVSPVRETIAKALKEMALFTTAAGLKEIVHLLIDLCKYEDWQAKYSGLIGIKYCQEVISPKAMPEIVKSIVAISVDLLSDLDEDVKGIAAFLLTGILEQCGGKSTRAEIEEFMEIDTVVDMCWEALEEEEDLAVAKAKIIHLLEKIESLGFSLQEIDAPKYLSLLRLLRCSIDSVRLAVLSLLKSTQVVLPHDALSAVLFSLLMEEEPEIRSAHRDVIGQIVQSLPTPTPPQVTAIVAAFLGSICHVYTHGSASIKTGSLVVIGERDLGATSDGCKVLGEEKVFEGRMALFEALVSTEKLWRACSAFFLEEKPSPFFVLFRAQAAALLSLADQPGARESAAELRKAMRQSQGGVEENRTDTNRGCYALMRMLEGEPESEDASSLLYLFNINPNTPVLTAMAKVISKCPARFESFFQLVVDCVCAREEAAAAEAAAETADTETPPSKRPKVSKDVPEPVEERWRMLALFKVLGNTFLETEAFAALARNVPKTCTFLKSTIECFTDMSVLSRVLSYATEHLNVEVVRYLVEKVSEHNETFVLAMASKLQEIRAEKTKDHRAFLSFLDKLIPFSRPEMLVPLVFPLIETMNTTFSEAGVRELGTKAFSSVVPVMHLRGEVKCSSDAFRDVLARDRERIRKLSVKEDVTTDVTMNVTLREYQKKGVEWIHFLKKSSLSGMLCDDMGLGKTVQVLALLAHEKLHLPAQAFKVLVLCPSALTGHWHAEISANFPTLTSTTIQDFSGAGICVSSYDKFRLSAEAFSSVEWFYLVLDEGHLIKNASTLLHSRVKSIGASHKLLLSGTPIQNSVSELWALFDVLMPGYLGTDKEFAREYLKPIMRGREGKGTAREGDLAKEKLEALHKRVLPFMLRRMKEAVLSDLPPKVIKDVFVSMKEVQKSIYEDVSSGSTCSGQYGDVSASSGNFAHLSRLIKICSHPSLLTPGDVSTTGLAKKYTPKEMKESHSGKVAALIDLLKVMIPSCKVLLFCQYKTTIDFLERCVQASLPELKTSRLDGTVKGDERAGLAKRFNASPEIGLMYLTTHAGGLGLNLTGADVVIFFEHDWNPMMDLQAMDRAHRLGQKKSVSVFRLITKGTIEESIMTLQMFKKYISKSVVNQQNVEIESMDTANVLERFGKAQVPSESTNRADEYQDFI
ncbi:TATA-binding protein-associated factor [Nematocida displodere]|uniref:TATA-binding protein-associated factor n=1 Tax=Nematocida displodere TaxID=1805483 RepID=A0A177EIT6_9MICR|nr:TATA-binding protein-associated factor [Nematocida displodere]